MKFVICCGLPGSTNDCNMPWETEDIGSHIMTDEFLRNKPLLEALWGSNPPPKKRRSRKHLEKSVLRECRDWLLNHEKVVYVERRNTGATQFENRFVPFGVTGGADLWCIWQTMQLPYDAEHGIAWQTQFNFHIEIECKRRDGKGRMSDAQKKFRVRCSEIGVPYFVVTSAKDLEQQLKEANLL